MGLHYSGCDLCLWPGKGERGLDGESVRAWDKVGKVEKTQWRRKRYLIEEQVQKWPWVSCWIGCAEVAWRKGAQYTAAPVRSSVEPAATKTQLKALFTTLFGFHSVIIIHRRLQASLPYLLYYIMCCYSQMTDYWIQLQLSTSKKCWITLLECTVQVPLWRLSGYFKTSI